MVSLADSAYPRDVIAEQFNCSVRTVYQILQNHKSRDTFEDLPRSGRPFKINDRALRHLDRHMDTSRRQTLGEITHFLNTSLSLPVCKDTISRTLNHRLGYHSRHARKKPFLTASHIEKRLAWTSEVCRFGEEEWKRIIWTDESSVELGKLSSTPLVWRRTDEENDPRCIVPTFKSGRSRVMIWGCIAHGIKGPLVFIPPDRRLAVDYVDLVLNGPLWDFYTKLYEERGVVKVMEDGAPTHTSKVTQNFRNTNSMEPLPHPAQSPDMNPIEHVWYLIKTRINKRRNRPKTVEEMKVALLEEWEKIDIKVINSLIESMPRRVQALIEAKGGATKY